MSLMSRRDAGKLIAAGGAGLLAARGRLAGATMIDCSPMIRLRGYACITGRFLWGGFFWRKSFGVLNLRRFFSVWRYASYAGLCKFAQLNKRRRAGVDSPHFREHLYKRQVSASGGAAKSQSHPSCS